jgi:hypothetical protein
MARAVPAKTVNPYATSRTDDQFATPDYAPREYDYTEPEQLGPYNTYGGPYANGLSYRFDGTPDPFRIETAIPDSYRQDASKPRAWWARVVGERNTRERTEQDNTAPYRELTQDAGTSGQRWARRAGETPPAPIRVTAELSPATGGLVVREFLGRTPHRFNGIHASLADRTRVGPDNIFGMLPARRARSTYRLDSEPFKDLLDDQQDYVANAVITQPEITVPRSRTYRLG